MVAVAPTTVSLAEGLSVHVLEGAWAHDDRDLARSAAAARLPREGWPTQLSEIQFRYLTALLAKAADSDWSWEVETLTGNEPDTYGAALDDLRQTSPVSLGLREPDAAFQHESELSPFDLRAEALARRRGMSENEIAMIKAGLEDVRAGRTISHEQLTAGVAAKHGW